MLTKRIDFLGFHFDKLTLQDVRRWLEGVDRDGAYRYVVTPNVDHIVQVQREPGLRQVYGGAHLCVCDSRVLRLLARFRGIRLTLVPGSDLCAALFSEVIRSGDRIAIVGADAADVSLLRAKYPDVVFAHHEPPLGLRGNPDARRSAAVFVAESQARFALFAVGSPQQEMIANEVADFESAKGIGLCIGAGLEFVTGKQKRAPRLIQRLGLEWAHRLVTNPRRLWRRYLIDGMQIIPIYLRWRSRTPARARTAFGLGIVAVALAAAYAVRTSPLAQDQPPAPAMDDARSPAVARLPPPDLLRPLSPEEAAKENAERPFVKRPDSQANPFVLSADIDTADRALTCLSQALYYEAGGEGADGARAVAQVVLNRVRHPAYPNSICGVVYQGSERETGCQFSFTCDGSLLRTPAASLFARSRKIAQEALNGKVFAPVGHATHFHADYVLPYWADSLDKTVQIGRHIFYRIRSALGDARAFGARYAGAEPAIARVGSALVLAPVRETEQLAKSLISDEISGVTKEVEVAAGSPSVPLVMDATIGTLMADELGPIVQVRRPKATSDCAEASHPKAIKPIGPNDLRASSVSSGC